MVIRIQVGTNSTSLNKNHHDIGDVAPRRTELYIVYQMGNSEEWTWFSPVGVFLSEKAFWDYANKKGIASNLEILKPTKKNEVRLSEPKDFVVVKSQEGEVPDVELEMVD